MPRLGLHMIVKDEAPVIERCLRSVLPLLDWWVICDTGSTDGTQDIVRRTHGRSSTVVLLERPWVSFGHNRQEALDAGPRLRVARPGDYTIWIDADDELVDLPAALPDLTADGYYVEVEYGAVRFRRLTLVRLDRPGSGGALCTRSSTCPARRWATSPRPGCASTMRVPGRATPTPTARTPRSSRQS